jgi:hypothetical protein
MVLSYFDLSIGLSIALALMATIVVLFVTPSTITTPIFALGHWDEGLFDNIKEGNTDSTPITQQVKSTKPTVRKGLLSRRRKLEII